MSLAIKVSPHPQIPFTQPKFHFGQVAQETDDGEIGIIIGMEFDSEEWHYSLYWPELYTIGATVPESKLVVGTVEA